MDFTRSYLRTLEAEDEHITLRVLVELATMTRSHPATGAPVLVTVDDPPDETWRLDAACRGSDPNLFYPAHPNDRCDAARAVCATCRVQDRCLEYALEFEEKFGVWGGRNQQQLNAMRKVPRRSRCRGCRRIYLRVKKQILYCDECRVERGDKRWMPEQVS